MCSLPKHPTLQAIQPPRLRTILFPVSNGSVEQYSSVSMPVMVSSYQPLSHLAQTALSIKGLCFEPILPLHLFPLSTSTPSANPVFELKKKNHHHHPPTTEEGWAEQFDQMEISAIIVPCWHGNIKDWGWDGVEIYDEVNGSVVNCEAILFQR